MAIIGCMRGAGSTKVFKISKLWPLLVPVLLLLPGLAGFPYPSPDASYSDLSITHYPNVTFLRQSIAEWGQIPLWSPQILSGYPFAANPLSGLWYPPGWLSLLLPLPLGFNITIMLHLLIGGLGMHLFARALGRSHQAALFSALAFEALPKIFAHFGAGHLTMIYAISWTPWLLLADVRSWQQEGSFWSRQPGIVLALIVLADPRWAAYAGLLWVAFSFFGNPQIWRSKAYTLFKQVSVAVALAAPLLFPLLEYSRLSTRAQLTQTDLLAYSLPLEGLFGLLAPQFSGVLEWVIYVGVVVLFLAILAICSTTKKGVDWFWIGSTVFALLFALGENIPGLAQLAQLPGLSLLRVPPRIWPIAAIALLMLAAGAFDGLLDRSFDQRTWRRTRLALTGIIGLQVGLALAIWFLTKGTPTAYLWSLAISLAALSAIFLFSIERIQASWLWAGLIALTLIDLVVVDSSLFATRPKEEVLAEGADAAAFLARQPGQFRVYSPSYSIPQQTAAEYGLELADGVDPLQLQAYANFMEEATGVDIAGYSITLPPFESGQPATDNAFAIPDAKKLAVLNVGYVASAFELDVEGLDLIERFDDAFVYHLAASLPRAFIEGSPAKAVTITEWTPNRIEITVEGPGGLVLSELVYPGWVATIDGNRAVIEPYQTILRSVDLEDGVHQVVFDFRPVAVFAGFASLLPALFALAIFYLREKRGAHQRCAP